MTGPTAREFAIAAHGDQKYNDEPYAEHLLQVVTVLHRYDINDLTVLQAAWLHDVIEDTPVSYLTLLGVFGAGIANLVWAVTNEPGKNRKERFAATYPKIEHKPQAILLKLADRIANTERSYFDGSRFLEMYREEYPAFRDALYFAHHEKAQPMWARLDVLLGGSR